jgi:hypothetical protein
LFDYNQTPNGRSHTPQIGKAKKRLDHQKSHFWGFFLSKNVKEKQYENLLIFCPHPKLSFSQWIFGSFG